MICPQCHKPMTIVGAHWICGEHETPVFVPVELEQLGTAEGDWLNDVVTAYPFPLAVTYRRLRDDVLTHRADEDALRQLIRLKDCVETLVKYLAIVTISARLDRGDPVDALDRQVLEKLVAPSLGSWAQGILQPLVRAPATVDDPRLRPLVQCATKKFFSDLQEFTALRNRVLGHGLVRDPREDRHDLNQWLPRLNGLLENARFLADWELVEAGDSPRSWTGDDAEGSPKPANNAAQIAEIATGQGEFLLVPTQGQPFSLYPFVYLLICPRCAEARRLFVYDSQKRFTTARQEANMIEHTKGHKCAFEDPAKALAKRFDEEMLLEYYRQHRRNFEVLEGKLTEFDFDTYRRRVKFFVGRRPVLEAIESLTLGQQVSTPDGSAGPFDRGYFLLVAEAGIGKTALLTYWIDHNEVCGEPIRFFWRRGRNLTTFDFLRHLYHGLLSKHNIEDQDPPQEEHDYRNKLDSLLKVVSERYLSEGEREVIVVDGLDEAGDGVDRQRALAAIPRELPPNVYFLLSSRPVRELHALSGQKERCLRYTIDPAAEWNRADVREYVERQLGSLLTTGEMSAELLPRIEKAADGNFLWAEQFCLSVLRGTLPPGSVAEALPRMQGLDELYREFWNRVIRTLSEDWERRLWRVVGILSVARTALTAEQVCRYAGIGDDEWIVCRAQLQQYLDEAELPNERDPESPLVGFRIYHASFRDFLLRDSGLVPKQHHERIVRAYLVAEEADSPLGTIDYQSWDRYGISCVPHHAVQAELWDELEALLTDIFFLEAKTLAGLVFELAGDFTEAAAALPVGRPRKKILDSLQKTLRRDIHFIHQHREDYPQALFQCLWNTYLDLDTSDDAAAEESQAERTAAASLLASWRENGEAASRGAWLKLSWPTGEPFCSGLMLVLRGHEGPIQSIAYSPDGARIASGSEDGTVRIWDASNGEGLAILHGHEAAVTSVAFSPSGDRIVGGFEGGTVRILDASSGEQLAKWGSHGTAVMSVAFSSSEDRIVSTSSTQLRVWDVASGQELTVSGHQVAGLAALSADGGRIATVTDDDNVQVRDAASSEPLNDRSRFVKHARRRSPAFGEIVDIAEILADKVAGPRPPQITYSDIVALPVGGFEISTWDDYTSRSVVLRKQIDEEREQHAKRKRRQRVKCVSLSEDGSRVACGTVDNIVQVWDVSAKAEAAMFRGHGAEITSVALSPDGKQVASGANDNTVRVWSLPRDARPAVCSVDGDEDCADVVLSCDGGRMASRSLGGTVQVWDTQTGAKVAHLCGHEEPAECLAISPDGSLIATALRSYPYTVQVWEVDSGEVIRVLRGHPDPIAAKALALCDDMVIAVGRGSASSWDIRSGKELAVFPIGSCVAISPDGRRIAFRKDVDLISPNSILWQYRVSVCDTVSGKVRAVLRVRKSVYGLAFSPDGQRVFIELGSGKVRVWDVRESIGDRLRQFIRGRRIASSHEYNLDHGRARLSVSQDGRLIACWDRGRGIVKIWDAFQGTGMAVLHSQESIWDVVFCGDGVRVASTGLSSSTIRISDLPLCLNLRSSRGHQGPVTSLAFSPDGTRIVSGSVDETVRVWDTASGAEIHRWKAEVSRLMYSPDGGQIVGVKTTGHVRIWDALSGKKLHPRTTMHSHQVTSVTFTTDGRLFAYHNRGGLMLDVAKSRQARIRRLKRFVRDLGAWLRAELGWSAAPSRDPFARGPVPLRRYSGPFPILGVSQWFDDRERRSVAFSLDGNQFARGFNNGVLSLLDFARPTHVAHCLGNEGGVRSVAFSPTEPLLASGATDKTLRLWDAASGEEVRVMRGHRGGVESVYFSPDGRYIASGSRDRTVRIWDVKKKVTSTILSGHTDCVTHVLFYADGRIVTFSRDRTIRVWDAATGAELAVLPRVADMLAVSPDGRQVALAGYDDRGYKESYTVRIWDAVKGVVTAILRVHINEVTHVSFTTDGRIVTCSRDGTIRMWDAATGAESAVWPDAFRILAISPDGRQIACDRGDHQVWIRDLAGATQAPYHGDLSKGVTIAAFSPDGRWLVSESDDGTFRVWDTASGDCLPVIEASLDLVPNLPEAADDRLRALASGGETVIEEAMTGQIIARFPMALNHIIPHPDGKTWAGSAGTNIHVITLKGDPDLGEPQREK